MRGFDYHAEPTPNLDDWIRVYEADDNEFWRTPFGHLQNLLDEAIERMQTAEAALRALRQEQR